MSLKKSLFWRQGKSCYNTLQWVTLGYKKLQKIGMYTTFNVAQEIFFLKEWEKLLQHVTTSYNALQDVTKTVQSKDYFQSCGKVLFFLKEVINCYNVLQQATMRSKKLQKIDMRTTFNVAENLCSDGRGGEKLLQNVTTSYNALQEVPKIMHP